MVDSDAEMLDADQDTQLQNNATSFLSEADLDEKFPDRPRNHAATWPFHTLFQRLFDPLLENRKRPGGAANKWRAKVGPHGPFKRSPHEERRAIVERFISQWRLEVGPDIYPAFRLIVPERDRDRAMYGIKEKAIGKILVKVMGINRTSEDAISLLNWKLPGQSVASRMAGDFGGRCYEILNKRPVLVDVGRMSIEEVNDLLDQLSQAPREEAQVKIFTKFYNNMNPTELMWLIRIILRQMKIGATEKTLFNLWHPDAEELFSVSSSLRRVCWDLTNPDSRLESDARDIALMQCFQPQLAQFKMHSFEKMVAKLGPTEDDPEFWIEEKLDGERMQLHMTRDVQAAGGRRFAFWSRKAKDYTYLYGEGLRDDSSALTRFLDGVFDDRVENIILDGEMITWDPDTQSIVPFGTLKTAAIGQQRNPSDVTQHRPVYKVFDILYLNNKALTRYTLRDRRKALHATVTSKEARLEIHTYTAATKVEEIEPCLREVVERKSEGLILKNPRSAYHLNERNDDWIKVKPEYMEEFGESLDCVVVGGYYGSGHRGGNLSSFLCGLIVKRNDLEAGDNPQKCWSFFKVGGGFTAQDYANIRHITDGKWLEWDKARPPTDWIELAGGNLQYERPDRWIKPEDSVVIEVKAASVNESDSFRSSKTLRFPRFKKIRSDRDWTTALSKDEFENLLEQVNQEIRSKKFKIDEERRKRIKRSDAARTVQVAGGSLDDLKTPYAGPDTSVFDGLTFFIMSDSTQPARKSKAELEQMVKANGGVIRQTHDASPDTICIADKRLVKVAALERQGVLNIVRPMWLFDCIEQAQHDVGKPRCLLPFEPKHMLHTLDSDVEEIAGHIDEYGDSYSRDVSPEELRQIFAAMPAAFSAGDMATASAVLRSQLEEHGHFLGGSRCWMFENTKLVFDRNGSGSIHQLDPKPESVALQQAVMTARFAGAMIAENLDAADAGDVTHVVIGQSADRQRVEAIRKKLSQRRRLPRIVSADWVRQSWIEGTRLDEERFAVV